MTVRYKTCSDCVNLEDRGDIWFCHGYKEFIDDPERGPAEKCPGFCEREEYYQYLVERTI